MMPPKGERTQSPGNRVECRPHTWASLPLYLLVVRKAKYVTNLIIWS